MANLSPPSLLDLLVIGLVAVLPCSSVSEVMLGGASDSSILSLTVFQRNCWLWTSGCQDSCWLWHHWRWRYLGKWCSTAFRLVLVWWELYASHGGAWHNTSIFFRLMEKTKFYAASEKRLTMCCRASSMCASAAKSSTNSSSVMSSSIYVGARRLRRLNRLPSVRKRM